MRRLLTHAPLAVTDARWTEPRTKANALLQAHFSRQPLSGDLAADQRTVVLQATRLLQVPLIIPRHCRQLWSVGYILQTVQFKPDAEGFLGFRHLEQWLCCMPRACCRCRLCALCIPGHCEIAQSSGYAQLWTVKGHCPSLTQNKSSVQSLLYLHVARYHIMAPLVPPGLYVHHCCHQSYKVLA